MIGRNCGADSVGELNRKVSFYQTNLKEGYKKVMF